jgi:hypothetical protein
MSSLELTVTPFQKLIVEDLNGTIGPVARYLLEGQKDIWEQELIRLVEMKQQELQAISTHFIQQIDQALSLGPDGNQMASILRSQRDQKIAQVIAQKVKVERRLLDVSRQLAAGNSSTDILTNLYRRAIERHQEEVGEGSESDKKLWATLQGRWVE